jgi:alkylation response protein AidB-like acyl-CoA dehydrogenase
VDIGSVTTRLQGVLPMIRARRQEIEQARRMPRDLVDELKNTGVFALGVPRAVGGQEAMPLDLMRTIETVAAADGSAGWCVMIATGTNIAAGYMDEAGAREVVADPTSPTAGIAAPMGAAERVDGGVRVKGRWSFASGITHCDWVWAGCMVMKDGRPNMTPTGPEIVHVWLPVKDVEIHDTWHVSGLRGTGSNDFSASGVVVPERRIFALLDPRGHRQEPLYQFPPMTLFVVQLAAVSLGIARASLDELTEIAQTKVPSLYQDPLAERAATQVDLARAEAALGGARAFLYEIVGDLWREVTNRRTPSRRQLALARAAATHATDTAAVVTRIAGTLGGGSALYSSASLQRHARDAEAITHHFTVAPHTWEAAGRVLLGREPGTPAF